MMGFSLDVRRGIVPRAYELSYENNDNQPVLLLKIRKEFVERCAGVVSECFLESFKKTHALDDFSPFGGEYFGFNQALKRRESTKDYVIYEIRIPRLKKELPEPCGHCKGTGIDSYFKRECSFCDGSAHVLLYDWKSLDAVSASLQIFANMAEIFDVRSPTEKNQLLTFQLNCGEGQGRYPLWGSYGIEFCDWLNTADGYHQFDKVIEAMWATHTHIYKSKNPEIYYSSFEAHVSENAWLILSCPGDACGIFPSGSWNPGRGMEFECHNMDRSDQQIMLLVGLAVLSDLARIYIK
jgi:hypothetical protein